MIRYLAWLIKFVTGKALNQENHNTSEHFEMNLKTKLMLFHNWYFKFILLQQGNAIINWIEEGRILQHSHNRLGPKTLMTLSI